MLAEQEAKKVAKNIEDDNLATEKRIDDEVVNGEGTSKRNVGQRCKDPEYSKDSRGSSCCVLKRRNANCVIFKSMESMKEQSVTTV